ncbi:MAG: regulatory signaling modulator protein AmpE [Gammaproteobacteria bacterium]|nr:regulatory signaling modulator protein AmpE [Gammaproteobacteria bacterium]
MTFIIIILSLLIERFFHWRKHRHWEWLEGYQAGFKLSISKWHPTMQALLILLPVLVLVGIIQILLINRLYHVPAIVFGVVVLLYCLGPDNLWVEFQARAKSEEHVDSVAFANAFFEASYYRIFAVIFWFAILGPVGAVLYRMIERLAEHSETLSSQMIWLRQCLDWLPIRILTFIFALGGHFTEVIACWERNTLHGLSSSQPLLLECGFAALDRRDAVADEREIEWEAIALFDRSLVVFVVLIALVVLAL